MDDLAIPFEPTPNDVVVFDHHDMTLKEVKLSPKRNDAYNRLLRTYKVELDRDKTLLSSPPPTEEEFNERAKQIVDTIVNTQKGRFLRLVGAGPDKKGLCVVMSVEACHVKVKMALRRMRRRRVRQLDGTIRKKKPKSSSKSQKKHLAAGVDREDDDDMESSDTNDDDDDDERSEEEDDDDERSEEEDEERSEEEEYDNERSEEDYVCPTKATTKTKADSEVTTTSSSDPPSQEIPFDPQPNDVISTKNRRYLKHPGNVAYRELLNRYFPQFQQQQQPLTKNVYSVAEEVMDVIVQQLQWRFLRWTSGAKVCTVMNRRECVLKVHKAFREMRYEAGSNTQVTGNTSQQKKSPAIEKTLKAKGIKKAHKESDDDEGDSSEADGSDDEELEEYLSLTTTVGNVPDQVIPFDPQPNDVVSTQNHIWHRHHTGNVAYRHLLDQYFPQFLLQSKQWQRRKRGSPVSQKVVDIILDQNKGRFLRWKKENVEVCTVMQRWDCLRKVQSAFQFRQKQSKAGSTPVVVETSQNEKSPAEQSKIRGMKDDAHDSELNNDENECPDDEERSKEVCLPAVAEASSDPQVIPFDPQPNDVVSTSNQFWITKHPGNVAYRNLLYSHFSKYLQQKASESVLVSEHVVDLIHQNQGRFLKLTRGNTKVCTVMSREACITKVQDAFQLMKSKKVKPLPTPVTSVQVQPSVKQAKSQGTKKAGGHHQSESSTSGGSSSGASSDDGSYNKKRRATTQHLEGERKKPAIAAAASRNHSVGSWTMASLQNGAGRNGLAPPLQLYGNLEDELRMRRWLNEHKMPQAVGDLLVRCGARDVDDIALLIESSPDDLKAMALLDLIKLKRAVQVQQSKAAEKGCKYFI